MVLNLYKKIGETPLKTVERFKEENLEYGGKKMTYAGRLDPMAEGVLLVLVGDEIGRKDEILHLDKEYEFEGLLGLRSDSYDVLGLSEFVSNRDVPEDRIKEEIQNLVGKREQEYPKYSSPNIKEILKRRRGLTVEELMSDPLKKISPTWKSNFQVIKIYESEFLGCEMVKLGDLKEEIVLRIKLVKGDFRQDEILKKWEEVFKEYGEKEFIKFKAKIRCSSGTYVRGLVHELGEVFKTGAITLSIKRTKVGNYETK